MLLPIQGDLRYLSTDKGIRKIGTDYHVITFKEIMWGRVKPGSKSDDCFGSDER